jgi:hypothetical protein
MQDKWPERCSLSEIGDSPACNEYSQYDAAQIKLNKIYEPGWTGWLKNDKKNERCHEESGGRDSENNLQRPR